MSGVQLDIIRKELAKHEPFPVPKDAIVIIANSHVISISSDPSGETVKVRTIVKGTLDELSVEAFVAELKKRHPTLFSLPCDEATEHAIRTRARDWLRLQPARRRVSIGSAQFQLAEIGSAIRSRARSFAMSALRHAGLVANGAAIRMRYASHGFRRLFANWRLTSSGGRAAYPVLTASAVLIAATYLFIWQPPTGEDQALAEAAPDPEVTSTIAPAPPRNILQEANSSPSSNAIAGIADVIDTATLRINGKIIRLFGVEWARGGQVADLTRYLQKREVACGPVALTELFRCKVAGKDLSEVVLYNGGGKATSAATGELLEAEKRAKSEGIGVWRKPLS
ncbi:MAG: hypothetical protein ABW003_25995 [Microvirga sp.]